MAFKDRDEALDDLFDHLFGDDEVPDEDRAWFDDKVVSWFDKLEGVKPPGRRRRSGEPSKIAGRRPGGSGGDQQGRRRQSSDGYGLSLFYGKGETG